MALSDGSASAAAACSAPKYATGVCHVYFSKGGYFPGQTVNFSTDPVFASGEKVDGFLKCRNGFTRSRGPWTAGSRHRVHGSYIHPKAPRGTCTLTLVGRRSGNSAHGSYQAKRHTAAANTGGSTAGGHVQQSAHRPTSPQVLGLKATQSNATAGASLPFTGADQVGTMVATGVMLVAAGGGLVFTMRRRRLGRSNA